MNVISANELKTRGVSILEEFLKEAPEAFISVHGKTQYVVMSVKTYQSIREMELQQALFETQQDLKQGKYHTNIQKHIQQLKEKGTRSK